MIQAGANLKRHRIADEIRRAIVAGTYPNGTLLPGENELAQQFSVSRSTIRSALGRLAEDKLIDTRSGVGSFVTFDGISLDQRLGWGRALTLGGAEVRTEIVRIERIVDPELAAAVRAASPDFLALDRIRRLADGTAVSLERSRVPAVGALAEAPERGLVDDSLTRTLAAAGLTVARGDQWIAAATLGGDDAALLGRAHGEWFLNTVRIARDGDDRFVEKVVSWLDPRHFRLHTGFGA